MSFHPDTIAPIFTPFPKMARLSRQIIVTEKIDGTNASILIKSLSEGQIAPASASAVVDGMAIYAGSRTRWITPDSDNFGFAAWVRDHAIELSQLGEGHHFGEWWGSGIQRGYGLAKGEKRFSLFNVVRWCPHGQTPEQIPSADPRIVKFQDVAPACCSLVPVIYRGLFYSPAIDEALDALRYEGSIAAPGFMDPEGIVVFHTSGNVGFKKTLKNDETPKSLI